MRTIVILAMSALPVVSPVNALTGWPGTASRGVNMPTWPGQVGTPSSASGTGRAWEDFLLEVKAFAKTGNGPASLAALWLKGGREQSVSQGLVDRLRAVSAGLRFVIVTHVVCRDSAYSVPYIVAISKRAMVPLSIVSPSEAAGISHGYLAPDGRRATPTVFYFRGNRLVGAWVERPAPLQQWMLGASRLPEAEQTTRRNAWYEWDAGETTITEIVSLAETTAAR